MTALATSFFSDMLQSIADRSRALIKRERREPSHERSAGIVEQCEELIGETDGMPTGERADVIALLREHVRVHRRWRAARTDNIVPFPAREERKEMSDDAMQKLVDESAQLHAAVDAAQAQLAQLGAVPTTAAGTVDKAAFVAQAQQLAAAKAALAALRAQICADGLRCRWPRRCRLEQRWRIRLAA